MNKTEPSAVQREVIEMAQLFVGVSGIIENLKQRVWTVVVGDLWLASGRLRLTPLQFNAVAMGYSTLYMSVDESQVPQLLRRCSVGFREQAPCL